MNQPDQITQIVTDFSSVCDAFSDLPDFHSIPKRISRQRRRRMSRMMPALFGHPSLKNRLAKKYRKQWA